MKLYHDEDFVAADGAIDTRKYAKFAVVDSAIEVYDEWHINIGTVCYDPALKYDLVLSILDDGEEVATPKGLWETPEGLAGIYSTEELEYTVYSALKALQIKQKDELEKRREAKKYHEIGQKLREIYVDGTFGDNPKQVWAEIAKEAEKVFAA